MPAVRIDKRFCKGCGLCVWVCQHEGLEIGDELNELGVYPVRPVQGVKCTGCGRCALMCPEGGIAIDVEDTPEPAPSDDRVPLHARTNPHHG